MEDRYGHLQGPPAFCGSAPFPAMDPRVMPVSFQTQSSFNGTSMSGGATPQMMPPSGSSAFGGSAPRLSDPRAHPVTAGSSAFGSSVSGPHKAFQPHPAVQPSVFSESAALPQSATQTDASGIYLASMETLKSFILVFSVKRYVPKVSEPLVEMTSRNVMSARGMYPFNPTFQRRLLRF